MRTLRAAVLMCMAWAIGLPLSATELPSSRVPEPLGHLVGQQLAATCANCHGTDGRTQGAGFISLAGMPQAQMVEILTLYKNGGRTGTIMHQIAKGYTDEQIHALAAFFADQKKMSQ